LGAITFAKLRDWNLRPLGAQENKAEPALILALLEEGLSHWGNHLAAENLPSTEKHKTKAIVLPGLGLVAERPSQLRGREFGGDSRRVLAHAPTPVPRIAGYPRRS
jgi:hypothetical protein